MRLAGHEIVPDHSCSLRTDLHESDGDEINTSRIGFYLVQAVQHRVILGKEDCSEPGNWRKHHSRTGPLRSGCNTNYRTENSRVCWPPYSLLRQQRPARYIQSAQSGSRVCASAFSFQFPFLWYSTFRQLDLRRYALP